MSVANAFVPRTCGKVAAAIPGAWEPQARLGLSVGRAAELSPPQRDGVHRLGEAKRAKVAFLEKRAQPRSGNGDREKGFCSDRDSSEVQEKPTISHPACGWVLWEWLRGHNEHWAGSGQGQVIAEGMRS